MILDDFRTSFDVSDGFDDHGVTRYMFSITRGGDTVRLNCSVECLEDLERKIHQALKCKDKQQESVGDILSGLVSIAKDMKNIVASHESRISMLEDNISNHQK